MRHPIRYLLAIAVLAAATPARADDLITTKMFKTTQDGTSEQLGTVTMKVDPDNGTSFHVIMHGLPPGQHGFHMHENPFCGPTLMFGVRIPAGAAGMNFDPDSTGRHEGPEGNGQLGDLPFITVKANGTVDETVVAPRIKDQDTLHGHALVVDSGGDNYKDRPSRDGGGGARIACGVID
jgi:Cu-Zn family superoxide dismutase